MEVFNEKCTVIQKVQEKDQYGSINEIAQTFGEIWCAVLAFEGFVKNSKGGQKRVQEIKLQTWLNNNITNKCNIIYNGTQYEIINTTHSRSKGITTITAIFNN